MNAIPMISDILLSKHLNVSPTPKVGEYIVCRSPDALLADLLLSLLLLKWGVYS